jgi:hypothetical protein
MFSITQRRTASEPGPSVFNPGPHGVPWSSVKYGPKSARWLPSGPMWL